MERVNSMTANLIAYAVRGLNGLIVSSGSSGCISNLFLFGRGIWFWVGCEDAVSELGLDVPVESGAGMLLQAAPTSAAGA